jgi:hypothetical protein
MHVAIVLQPDLDPIVEAGIGRALAANSYCCARS